jgi:hypothetical protein
MVQIDFERKPSFVSINVAIRKALAKGATWVQLVWGENQITLEKTQYGWIGYGWIGKSSGHDIADKLNRNGA